MKFITLLFFFSISFSSAEDEVRPLRLKLPTFNTGLVTGKLDDFYMYTNRNLESTKAKPWTGGTWGYSREARSINSKYVFTKFHEGIDIKPLKRDSVNRPLDIVRSISDGIVVYTNTNASLSSYGIYVVIKHDWGYGPFYSLYAHLAEVSCYVGERVKAESPLGKMGYTGVGINISRAHLHLELGIMMNDKYALWHTKYYGGSPNHHGIYNGQNLNGLDVASLLLANHQNPKLTIDTFLKNIPTHYKITVQRTGDLYITKTYPWLKKGDHTKPSPSWEISFSASAFPLSVSPSDTKVSEPKVTDVSFSEYSHAYSSRGFLAGSGNTAALTKRGKQYLSLVMTRLENSENE